MRMLAHLARNFSRAIPALPLMTLAALCAAAPTLAEDRVKHPQPVDSLLYPGEYGASPTTETGRHGDYKDKSDARATETSKGAKATDARDAKAPAAKKTATPKTGAKTTPKKSVAVSDTNERPIGTPGSPTTKGVRGTPGEKPIPGRK